MNRRNWLLLLVAVVRLPAAEFNAQILDGLKRPISDVECEVFCESGKEVKPSLHLRSDRNGLVYGNWTLRGVRELVRNSDQCPRRLNQDRLDRNGIESNSK